MKAIVFDLDGTLIDSAPDIHAAANRMLAELGRGPLDLPTVTSFIGNGVPKLVERCLEATGGPDPRGLELMNRCYGVAPADLSRPYPGVLAALDTLQAEGVPLGICTNKPQGVTAPVLEQLSLARFFGSVVGGDRLAVRKPDPAPLRLCFEELGADPAQGLYVGDSETDEATAHALGVPFALFTEGYRKKPVDAFDASIVFDRFDAFEP